MEEAPVDVAISVQGLTKSFGRTPALQGLDLHVGISEVHGFLGPNGAGKTTTLRVLLGLLARRAFDVQGSVAKSTHAGIPWLKRIREAEGHGVQIWPFDGWRPDPARSVIAEVYPSIFRKRYARDDRSPDEQDAYAVARWLSESAALGSLSRYFDPPLSPQERQIAEKEGWILGVT